MTSTHPYRQAYPSLPASSSTSSSTTSPPLQQHSNHMSTTTIDYPSRPHQPHPSRPLDRPYANVSNNSFNNPRATTHSNSNSKLASSPSPQPQQPFSANHSARNSPVSDFKNVPPAPFKQHQRHKSSSASSIDTDSSIAKAPDTPQGIAPMKDSWPSNNNNNINSTVSSPLLLSGDLSQNSSFHGSQLSLSKPPELNSQSHGRSTSSLSLITAAYNNESHTMIAQQLGNNSNSLLPKLKAMELYRLNAKKSHDPEVLFQYARYMLNTAIFIKVDDDSNDNINGSSSSLNSHKKSKSSTSLMANLNLDADHESSMEEKKEMKRRFLKEAVHYLKKLSDKGYTEAQYLLGDAYSSGVLGKSDDKEAFILFQAAAKHAHVESAYRTSFCYEIGLGTSRDSRKALEFLRFAATKNHPSAMYKMGIYSFHGRMGLSQNTNTKKDGIKWLKRATEVANELIAAAPYELGKIHYDGFRDIIIQDKVYALDLYRLAASLGHVQSAAILAKEYELGDVIPQDPELSIHYYTQAALGGDAESMLGLCGWFMVGATNLEKNENEAFEWALKAANIGLPKAQFATGHFLEKGIGCEKNKDAAMVWFQKAAEKGDERAIKKVKGTNFDKTTEKKGWVKKMFSS